tara:strand:- start:1215 stop:1490 length:276 start_codon:yes stop_codon:yes gene_type:complete
MIAAIIILSIALLGSLYANYNLLKNYEQSEEYVENLETWVNQFSKNITNMNQQLKKIDEKGSFESDDEVGYFYKQLKKMIDQLNTLGADEE